MTETSCSGILTKASDIEKSEKHAYESIGSISPFLEVKIADLATGNAVPFNTDGEICIRSRLNMKGYWDDAKKTAETIDENGWLHTGDVAAMDTDGYVYFKSRAKEIIIRGGANIYPVTFNIYQFDFRYVYSLRLLFKKTG